MDIQVFDNSRKTDFYSERYLIAFKAWRKTWQEEFTVLKSGHCLFSDNFTRQNQILTVFIDKQCAALTFFHEVDLSTELGRTDSYFEPWPTEVLNQICAIESKVLVCSALTVSKEFRGQKVFGIPIKDILAAASLYHFRHTSYPVMVGNMRNTRGANKLVYKFGAELLKTVDCNSEPSDLVFFKRDSLPPFPIEIETLIKKSWISRTDEEENLQKIA